MSFPRVSIIIPVYNVGPYVEDCIRSVMRQTYAGPMECIIVDDCGTDNSMEIINQLITEYNGPISFNVLHHTHNRGLSAARNTGMDAANGDYLFFLDSDDEISGDCITSLTAPLKDNWFDVIEGKMSEDSLEASNELEIFKQPLLLQNYKKKWGVPAWNKLYRISFIRESKLRFKESLIHEDILWSFQIACVANSLCVVNKSTYIYKRREGSITDLDTDNIRKAVNIDIMREMSSFVDSHRIKHEDVFRFFAFYFYQTLPYYSSSLSAYSEAYKTLRPLFVVTAKSVLQKNHYQVKACCHDLHFLLPTCIAPYWQYFVYHRLRPLLRH